MGPGPPGSLWLSALTFLSLGAWVLVRPTAYASIVQLDLGGIISASDLWAVYGGLVLGRLVSLVVDGVPERPGLNRGPPSFNGYPPGCPKWSLGTPS